MYRPLQAFQGCLVQTLPADKAVDVFQSESCQGQFAYPCRGQRLDPERALPGADQQPALGILPAALLHQFLIEMARIHLLKGIEHDQGLDQGLEPVVVVGFGLVRQTGKSLIPIGPEEPCQLFKQAGDSLVGGAGVEEGPAFLFPIRSDLAGQIGLADAHRTVQENHRILLQQDRQGSLFWLAAEQVFGKGNRLRAPF